MLNALARRKRQNVALDERSLAFEHPAAGYLSLEFAAALSGPYFAAAAAVRPMRAPQKSLSVVEVTKPLTHTAGVPVHNGLNDPRLGAADRMSTCSTCKNTYAGGAKVNDCPGHFGHIEVRAAAVRGARGR